MMTLRVMHAALFDRHYHGCLSECGFNSLYLSEMTIYFDENW